jgi:hypothetical protein
VPSDGIIKVPQDEASPSDRLPILNRRNHGLTLKGWTFPSREIAGVAHVLPGVVTIPLLSVGPGTRETNYIADRTI